MYDVDISFSSTPNPSLRIATAEAIISDVFLLASSVVGSVYAAVIENEAVSGCMETSAYPETDIVGIPPGRSAAVAGSSVMHIIAAAIIAFAFIFFSLVMILHPCVCLWQSMNVESMEIIYSESE